MKSLVGLMLALFIALPACSAENGPATPPPGADVATAPDPAPAVVENTETPPVVAQLDDPAVAQVEPSPDPAPAAKPIAAPAERADIIAGKHYRVLNPTQPTSSSPDKIEVAEFFMYSCPHCMSFEPFIKEYVESKPAYVSFLRIPANFNSMARVHSKAFYMAETLGILEDVHSDLFTEYHTKRNRLAEEKAVIDFFVAQGVTGDDAGTAFNSFAVDTKVRQADNLGRRYGIDSVPALVINGKYVTSGSMTGSISKLREVVDYLTAKEAAEL
ncbi:MAG: thiol:disulfide interchange protein DsbA/DsbL [Gammaproteobacteria bacterium]|nr:thiol:disulfide interchange protein DsbA/DsbL [Gammaproteobacteria bacterium]